jgi:hypothetical protein
MMMPLIEFEKKITIKKTMSSYHFSGQLAKTLTACMSKKTRYDLLKLQQSNLQSTKMVLHSAIFYCQQKYVNGNSHTKLSTKSVRRLLSKICERIKMGYTTLPLLIQRWMYHMDLSPLVYLFQGAGKRKESFSNQCYKRQEHCASLHIYNVTQIMEKCFIVTEKMFHC